MHLICYQKVCSRDLCAYGDAKGTFQQIGTEWHNLYKWQSFDQQCPVHRLLDKYITDDESGTGKILQACCRILVLGLNVTGLLNSVCNATNNAHARAPVLLLLC